MEASPEIFQIHQSKFMSDSNKSSGRLADGICSCTTTHISSSSCSVSKTSIVYEYEKSVKIKEEIIEERHQGGEHNLLSEKSQLDEKSISSGNRSAFKTAIVYEYDETLEIKEEIIQDSGAVMGEKHSKKCESTWNTVDTIESSSLSAKKLRSHKRKKIHESKPEPLEKYNFQKYAQSYKQKFRLNAHQKFECRVTPQFICEFCDKHFKHKRTMSCHVGQVHQKTHSNQNKKKIQESEKKCNIYRLQKTKSSTFQATYNCAKCSRSYNSLSGLHYHNLVKHAAVRPQFICDICGHKANKKSNLLKHISSRHFKNSKTSQATHNCDKCFKNYSSLSGLYKHNRVKHAAVKPQFICDVCGYKMTMKSHLSNHISSCHFKNSKTSQAMHNCDKCSRSYSSLKGLKKHDRLKHVAVKAQFICDACGYKTTRKGHFLSHISFRHFKNSDIASEA